MKKKIFKILPIFMLIIFICTNIVYADTFDFQGYDPNIIGCFMLMAASIVVKLIANVAEI